MNQMNIGKFIQELRKENNMTQEELAEKLGVTSKSVSRWENGKTMPDISLFNSLAAELNCTVSELLNGQKMTKEELLDMRDTINNLIEYETNKQVKDNQKFNKYNLIGSITLVLALFHNAFGYLNYIFTLNIVEFVQGSLFGISICANMISLYNRNHNITLCENKREIIKNINKK